VLEPVITVPLSPEIDVANVAQSPEKVEGIASDSCGNAESPPHPTSVSADRAAINELNFGFDVLIWRMFCFQNNGTAIIYNL
jgi:hypothetical protein